MIFKPGDKVSTLPIYNKLYDPRIAYAIGNRDIGLLFGQRVKPNMLWQMRVNAKSQLTLNDDSGISYILGKYDNIKKLSFTFDTFSYPIVAIEVEDGIKVYKFTNVEDLPNNDNRVLLIELPSCRDPKLVPSNTSDLGSINNQPFLFYIKDDSFVEARSLKTNFTTILEESLVTNLTSTDILNEVSITQNGKIQLGISKLKTIA